MKIKHNELNYGLQKLKKELTVLYANLEKLLLSPEGNIAKEEKEVFKNTLENFKKGIEEVK